MVNLMHGLILGLFMGGCTNMVAQHFEKTVDITKGTMNLPGLTEPVTVRRDALGIPFIEARTMGDMAMAMGYVHASDRLTQMAAIRLMSEGRLSEMAGASMIDLDLYMRTMNLRQTALNLLKNISPENLALLERYCTGVNAYLDRHKDNTACGTCAGRIHAGILETHRLHHGVCPAGSRTLLQSPRRDRSP